MTWRIFHKAETDSTNRDARTGRPGDVFTADYQSAGRGRLDHRWHARAGENLMMSAVVDVAGLAPDHVATFPLVVGLSVCEAVRPLVASAPVALKWPNDVLAGGRKLSGILCERNGDRVIAGIGVNVAERAFPDEIVRRATSLALLCAEGSVPACATVRDAILAHLAENVVRWREKGFAALYAKVAALDFLKGRSVEVARTDGDPSPARGVCGGIARDGSLLVGGACVYAGEAHVASC